LTLEIGVSKRRYETPISRVKTNTSR
jgi:hypothetical protein